MKKQLQNHLQIALYTATLLILEGMLTIMIAGMNLKKELCIVYLINMEVVLCYLLGITTNIATIHT